MEEHEPHGHAPPITIPHTNTGIVFAHFARVDIGKETNCCSSIDSFAVHQRRDTTPRRTRAAPVTPDRREEKPHLERLVLTPSGSGIGRCHHGVLPPREYISYRLALRMLRKAPLCSMSIPCPKSAHLESEHKECRCYRRNAIHQYNEGGVAESLQPTTRCFVWSGHDAFCTS